MSGSLEEAAASYSALISKTAKTFLNHRTLDAFVSRQNQVGAVVAGNRVTVIELRSNSAHSNSSCQPKVDFRDISQLEGLSDELARSIGERHSCRIFLVENVSPRAVSLLGGCFNIDTQFFADHIKTPTWHSVEDISRKVPHLPSSQTKDQHLSIRFANPKTIESMLPPNNGPLSQKDLDLPPPAYVNDRKYLTEHHWPVPSIDRGAGVLNPLPRGNKQFDKILHVHEQVTIWFSNRNADRDGDGWTELYQLVASNFLVVTTYITRELETLEYILQEEQLGFQKLEEYLMNLYACRRRCMKNLSKVQRARAQCLNRGQPSWPRDKDPSAISKARELERDFSYLQDRFQELRDRTEKNIELLTSLVAIGEGKQTLRESRGVTRLTLLATVFLPFSTIAAILGMNGGFASEAEKFWVFWAAAVPITVFVIALFVGYDGI